MELTKEQQFVLDAWRKEAKRAQNVPNWSTFDPIDFRLPLPYLIVAELTPDRILYRLVGTSMAHTWGADFTGKYLDEVMQDDYRFYIEGLFRRAAEIRAPVYSHSKFQWFKDRHLDTTRLFVPYCLEGEEVGIVLVCQIFNYDKVGPDEPRSIDLERDHTEHETVDLKRFDPEPC